MTIGLNFSGFPENYLMIKLRRPSKEAKIEYWDILVSSCILFHSTAQYRLESDSGKLVWFHRNQAGITVFSVRTDQPVLLAGKWTHVLVTYAAATGRARVFIDGRLEKEETTDTGVPLSTDWGKYAGIGWRYPRSS